MFHSTWRKCFSLYPQHIPDPRNHISPALSQFEFGFISVFMAASPCFCPRVLLNTAKKKQMQVDCHNSHLPLHRTFMSQIEDVAYWQNRYQLVAPHTIPEAWGYNWRTTRIQDVHSLNTPTQKSCSRTKYPCNAGLDVLSSMFMSLFPIPLLLLLNQVSCLYIMVMVAAST